MKRLGHALLAALLTLAAPALAQQSPVVVELFTSQGCSSCPAADKLLHELAEREDVIALGLHVDYWDYIGWKDPFGDPAHAERQRAYAAAGGRHMIYTPEMVVQGQTDIVGAKPMKLSQAIATHTKKGPQINLVLERRGDDLTIRAVPLGALSGPLTVHMLRYTPRATTQIKRGENAGHTYDYANIVEGWQVLTTWDGQAVLSLTASAPGDKPAVILIQRDGTGPILAAARLR
ncbi:MAG: DUF1223 domain-containing protein [Sulfitobacter sp.]|nr:DUF1223 domain-containing protein [Sulfitobacter sp.]